MSEGGSGYTLMGTAGQPDAATLSDGDYTLIGGFWSGAGTAKCGGYTFYLPVGLKNYP